MQFNFPRVAGPQQARFQPPWHPHRQHAAPNPAAHLQPGLQQAQKPRATAQPAFFGQPHRAAPAPFTVPLHAAVRGVDYSHLHLGAPIGSGISKTAYPVLSPHTGQPTGQVLLVERNRFVHTLDHELAVMQQLEGMGFPVAPVHSTGTCAGKPAILMPRMEGVYKPTMLKLPGQTDALAASPYATRATVRSLQLILRQMAVHNIRIKDLQVLMNPATGKLYITDPMGIREGVTQDHLLGRLMPNLLSQAKPMNVLLERLYERFPDMRPQGYAVR